MKQFKIGDIIYENESDKRYKIIGVDYVLNPIPWYTVKDCKTGEITNGYFIGYRKEVNQKEVFKNGEIVVEDFLGPFHICVIKYCGMFCFVETFNDKSLIQFKELT